MFQFAFGHIFSKKRKTFFLFDINYQKFELGFFELYGYYGLLSNRFLSKIYNQLQKRKNVAPYINVTDCFKEYDYSTYPSTAYFEGYFQDHRLYKDHQDELIKFFSVRRKFRKTFDEKYGNIVAKEKIIVISFRFGDYSAFDLFNGESLIIPIIWYEEILKSIESTAYKIFCISDDISHVQSHFKAPEHEVYFVKDDMITQFLLLQNADICIITNSTFAWWGAFLNTRAVEVYVPEFFLGFPVKKEVPPHIYPSKWIQVPVKS